MSLRDELDAVRGEYGRLTPALVVDAARPKNHPLHSRFEWDDKIAGESYRRVQAQELIRSVRITYREPTETTPGESIRAYHAVPSSDGWQYEPAEDIAEDPFKTKLVLAEMEREWQALHRRYGHFAEFIAIVRRDTDAA